jgi:hypothetical protein
MEKGHLREWGCMGVEEGFLVDGEINLRKEFETQK